MPYNKTLIIKIGNSSLNLDVYLKVDQSQKWILTAPNGQYPVQVVADGVVTGASVLLTGNEVNIKKAYAGTGLNASVVWIFIIAVLLLVVFVFFKRGYQKNFVGYIESRRNKKVHEQQSKMAIIVAPGQHNSKADISLSIKGDKQEVSIMALKVKNMTDVKKTHEDGSAYEAVKKAIEIAENEKAAIYENDETIFCIFSATRTKTFKNEMTALKAAKKILEILEDHNKLSKQKINFGISLNNGTIVAKQEPTCFKFMAMGNVMTQIKKIASAANNEILMGSEITDKLRTSIKAEKRRKDDMDVYSPKEIKNSEEREKFLKGFMKRMEKGK